MPVTWTIARELIDSQTRLGPRLPAADDRKGRPAGISVPAGCLPQGAARGSLPARPSMTAARADHPFSRCGGAGHHVGRAAADGGPGAAFLASRRWARLLVSNW